MKWTETERAFLLPASSTMIKGMSSSLAGWVSIICLTSVGIAASQGVVLHTISQVAARCGQNVTLTCEASSSRKMVIKSFAWLATGKILCQYVDGRLPDHPNTDNNRLTLRLVNVMPVHEGIYYCKLRSTVGVNSSITVVKVQDCLGSPGSSINKSHAMCSYSGVYPSGTVHWFQGDINLTDSASSHEERDQSGLFNVRSTIDHKGRLNEPYSCSLWIPSAGKYLYSQQLPIVKKAFRSSGSTLKLQWISLLVEVMMVKFMT